MKIIQLKQLLFIHLNYLRVLLITSLDLLYHFKIYNSKCPDRISSARMARVIMKNKHKFSSNNNSF